MLILPGLIDAHVHLRVPGGEHKEDFISGSSAALAGGFTTLLAMPNTNPPLVTVENWRNTQSQAEAQALCDVHHFAGGSEAHLDQLPELAKNAVGLKLYLDATFGPLRLQDPAAIEKCFELWPASKPICLHAELDSLRAGVELAERHQKHIHVCHVARKEEVEMIAKAQDRGINVTAEVTAHHLFLTEDDTQRLGPYGDMRPRLQSQQDQDALWQHLGTTIEVIASDHAPHAKFEKEGFESQKAFLIAAKPLEEDQKRPIPPGIPGLESTLPLMLTAVAENRLSLETLIKLLHDNPKRLFNLPEQPETWVEVDETAKYIFPDHPLYTKCGWSPFQGMRMTGAVRRVVLRGKEVYKNGIINYSKEN